MANLISHLRKGLIHEAIAAGKQKDITREFFVNVSVLYMQKGMFGMSIEFNSVLYCLLYCMVYTMFCLDSLSCFLLTFFIKIVLEKGNFFLENRFLALKFLKSSGILFSNFAGHSDARK